MSITTKSAWGDVERRARAYEQSVCDTVLLAAGLPLVTITVEDRMRGAIVSAMSALKAGQNLAAYQELEGALKL